MNCTECNAPAQWVENKAVYGRNYGESYMIWLCPQCGAYVGCHNNTRTPKGTFASAELRKWRVLAHAAIDPLWQSGEHSRKWIYDQLRDAFGEYIHVGESDIARCKEIIITINKIFPNQTNSLLP